MLVDCLDELHTVSIGLRFILDILTKHRNEREAGLFYMLKYCYVRY